MTLASFAALRGPVLFEDGTEELLAPLRDIVRGWEFDGQRRADGEPLIRVDRHEGRYRIRAPWLDEPAREETALRAAANLAVDLAEAFMAENPSRACLHCGSVEIGGRLVLFPSRSRAGKSTLVARLAAEGLRVFGDDILLLDGDGSAIGMSVGIAPRLRLPLPSRAGAGFRAFVDGHAGPGNERYLYLDLPPRKAPLLGAQLRIGAIVLLDRVEDEQPARLSRARRGDGMQELILQNIATGLAFGEMVARMHALSNSLPCHQLTYRDLDDAAALLVESFRRWPEEEEEGGTSLSPAGGPKAVPARATSDARIEAGAETPFRAAPAMLHEIEGEGFLVPADGGELYRLNTVSAGLWRLLSSPLSAGEAAGILAGAFPQTDPALVEADVRAIFAELDARGLIVRAE